MGTAPLLESSTSNGCSCRQDTHHDAQTLSSQTLPRMSATETLWSGWCNCGNSNAGAGLLMSGDGISRGFSRRPTARNSTSTTKMASGIKWRFTALFPDSWGDGTGASQICSLDVVAPAKTIAPVRYRKESAHGHQHAAAPDPVNKRLVLNAHRPGGCARRLAHGNVKVAREAGIDGRLGGGHLLHRVE